MSIQENNKKQEKELGYKLATLIELYKQFKSARKKKETMMRVLDAYDRGLFWSIVAPKLLPQWTVKPDNNWINYIKTNYTNSLYVGSYRANVYPRFKEHMPRALSVNEFLDYMHEKLNIPELQLQVGERAALLNYGVLQFGWNSDIIDGFKQFEAGDLEVKFIDNLAVYLDPSTKGNYLRGRAIFLEEEFPIIELRNEDLFRERLEEYIKLKNDNKEDYSFSTSNDISRYVEERSTSKDDQSVKLVTCYFKYFPPDATTYRIDCVWVINDEFILAYKKDLKPKTFPIRVLYANKPIEDPYGTPTTQLVLYNAISLNIIDAIESSYISASINRSQILSRRSGIPEALFAKEGKSPGKLWIAETDVNNVVGYIDFPELPHDRQLLKQRLETAIMRISGVDDKYTGRDTGSIQTTGGMDMLQQRLTMSDNVRIANLQKFIKEVDELILSFYLEYGGNNRSYLKKQAFGDIDDTEVIAMPFEDMKKQDVKFDFTCNITPNLPMNVARLADTATQLMEMQMQYQMEPPLITHEEWLAFQDIPQKYHILRRIQQDRFRNDREEVMSDIVNYAGMTAQGMRPESAVNQLAQERQLKRNSPKLGNTGGSVQARQEG